MAWWITRGVTTTRRRDRRAATPEAILERMIAGKRSKVPWWRLLGRRLGRSLPQRLDRLMGRWLPRRLGRLLDRRLGRGLGRLLPRRLG